MRTTSNLYKALRKQTGAFYEIELVQGTHTYTIADLYELKLYPALFEDSGPQVGITHATQCDVKFRGSSMGWPRMAQFTVRLRISSADGSQKSEWLSMGTYYTDERKEDAYGNLSITAYDGMLLTEQYWTDKIREQDIPASWPITSKAWADMMVNAGLIEFDSRTTLDDTAAIIGLNTASTIRDNLKTIAAAHGGNWQITPEGKLRLIPLVNMVDGQAAIAGIAIAGISVVGDGVIESAANPDYAFLGMDVQTFENSPALEGITGVNLETEAGNVAAAGTTTGYVLNASCEFASSVGTAELCLSKVRGYVYKPFSAGKALLDPAAEVGDLVIINGRSYQMMAIDWNINTWPTADIGAAYEQEVDHEYTILSLEAKNYRKTMAATDDKLKLYPTTTEMRSAIEQSEQAIELSVSETYVTRVNYVDDLDAIRGQLDGKIETYYKATNPATAWTDSETKSKHVGDLWYCTTDALTGYQKNMTYRWTETSTNVYKWEEYGGVPTDVYNKIAEKGQIWVTQPTVPYNEGDLWFTDDGLLLTCVNPKGESGSFAQADWNQLTNYTDDTAAQAAREHADDINTDLSGKINDVQADVDAKDTAMGGRVGTVETAVQNIGTHLKIYSTHVEISHDQNKSVLQMKGDEIGMYNAGDRITYWSTSKMVAPRQVYIPTFANDEKTQSGGSLRIGDLLFQPRSSGNMSILWVGDQEEEES